ncbi:type IV secretion system protein [Halomonas elongata]|uniref:Type IV secretion system protein n=1 Tax=Halomonas elongata TaxID=2746 RepID=A0A1B8NVC5_HALEL|nr:type IV secretion system protein [Halomonas elongata]OBX33918.1 type IV secretion system protein [Halomonas elongata]
MNINFSCARKMVAGLALATSIGLSQPMMAGGIPVIDVSNLTQSIAQVQHMLNQIDKMKRQLATANRQLDNMSGSRGLANVIDSVYDRTVKVDPEDVLNRYGIQGSGDLGLSGDAGELYDAGNNHAAEWLAQSQKAWNRPRNASAS